MCFKVWDTFCCWCTSRRHKSTKNKMGQKGKDMDEAHEREIVDDLMNGTSPKPTSTTQKLQVGRETPDDGKCEEKRSNTSTFVLPRMCQSDPGVLFKRLVSDIPRVILVTRHKRIHCEIYDNLIKQQIETKSDAGVIRKNWVQFEEHPRSPPLRIPKLPPPPASKRRRDRVPRASGNSSCERRGTYIKQGFKENEDSDVRSELEDNSVLSVLSPDDSRRETAEDHVDTSSSDSSDWGERFYKVVYKSSMPTESKESDVWKNVFATEEIWFRQAITPESIPNVDSTSYSSLKDNDPGEKIGEPGRVGTYVIAEGVTAGICTSMKDIEIKAPGGSCETGLKDAIPLGINKEHLGRDDVPRTRIDIEAASRISSLGDSSGVISDDNVHESSSDSSENHMEEKLKSPIDEISIHTFSNLNTEEKDSDEILSEMGVVQDSIVKLEKNYNSTFTGLNEGYDESTMVIQGVGVEKMAKGASSSSKDNKISALGDTGLIAGNDTESFEIPEEHFGVVGCMASAGESNDTEIPSENSKIEEFNFTCGSALGSTLNIRGQNPHEDSISESDG